MSPIIKLGKYPCVVASTADPSQPRRNISELSRSTALFVFGKSPFASIIISFFIYSLYAIESLEAEFEQKDARQIVIDEVIGQSIPILFIEYTAYSQTQLFGADLYLYVTSFFLFRFFDILKPFPIGYFDKNYKNSFGILFDDVLAGVYTLMILLLLRNLFN